MSDENKVQLTVTADISNLTQSMRAAGEATKDATDAIQINSEKAQLILKKLATEGSKNVNTLIDSLKREALSKNDMLGVVTALKEMGTATGDLTSKNNRYIESLKQSVAFQKQEVEFQQKIATARARADLAQGANSRGSIQARAKESLNTGQYEVLNALLAQSAQEQQMAADASMKAAAASKEEARALNAEADAHRLNSRALMAEAEAYTRSNAEAGLHEELSTRIKTDAVLRPAMTGNFTGVRAAGAFLASIPGATEAVSGLFNLIGAAAVVSIFVDIGKSVTEAIRKIEQMPQAIDNAFGQMNAESELTNASLDLTNDKLRDRINILEHKPANGVARALDEARVHADQLAASLSDDNKGMDDLFKKLSISPVAGFFTNKESTKTTENRFRGWNTQIDNASDQEADDLENAHQASLAGDKAGAAKYTAAAQAAHQLTIMRLRQAIKAGQDDEKLQQPTKSANLPSSPWDPQILNTKDTDRSANLELDKGVVQQYRNRLANIEESDDNSSLVGKLDDAENGAKGREQAKQAWEQKLASLETGEEEQELFYGKSIFNAREYWQQYAATFKAGGKDAESEYLAVLRKIEEASETGPQQSYLYKRYHELQKQASESATGGVHEVQKGDELGVRLSRTQSEDDLHQGPRYRQYNLENAQMGLLPQEQANALAEQNLRQQEATGSITKFAAASQQAALHTSEYQVQLQKLNDELASVQGDTDLKTRNVAEYAKSIQDVQKQLAELDNQRAVQTMQDQEDIAATSFSSRMRESLNEWVNDSQDAAKAVAAAITGTMDSVNGSLSQALTGRYRTNHERMFALRSGLSSDARGAAGQLTNYGLKSAEGSVLKGFGYGGKADGSQNNPFWVRIADAMGKATGTASRSLGGSLSGGLSHVPMLGKLFGGGGSSAPMFNTGGMDPLNLDADTTSAPLDASSSLGAGVVSSKVTSSILGDIFQGKFADGGDVVADRPAIIGERGPEMFVPRGAGRIIPNDQAFGGQHVHFSPNIDARGSSNPAETQAMINRSLREALPQFSAAANQARTSANKRVPSSRRV